MDLSVAGLVPLRWTHAPGQAVIDTDAGVLQVTAAAGEDWSNHPLTGERNLRATMLGRTAPDNDFTLSATVRVESERTTFDAGALGIWCDSEHWAKLCFEHSPQGENMVVSVVTNGFSDDANGEAVRTDAVGLRICRTRDAWAFHARIDGGAWRFVRLFRLGGDGPITAGFLAQTPLGTRCVASFSDIALSQGAPADLRDGS